MLLRRGRGICFQMHEGMSRRGQRGGNNFTLENAGKGWGVQGFHPSLSLAVLHHWSLLPSSSHRIANCDLVWVINQHGRLLTPSFPASWDQGTWSISHLQGSSCCLNIASGSGFHRATGNTGALQRAPVMCQASDYMLLDAKQVWSSGSFKFLREHKHWPKIRKMDA